MDHWTLWARIGLRWNTERLLVALCWRALVVSKVRPSPPSPLTGSLSGRKATYA